jgi:hypothetical protein
MSITVRVRAKTDPTQYRLLEVSEDGSVIHCNCDGFDGTICSHIDAVLVARERAMVHQEDWSAASAAAALVGSCIVAPENWQASWRRNLRWRGLSTRGPVHRRVRDGSKPVVCFTGNPGRGRSELIAEAIASGWEFVDSPSPFTDVLVAANPTGGSRKLKTARKNGTPIVTLEEWSILMNDGVLPC